MPASILVRHDLALILTWISAACLYCAFLAGACVRPGLLGSTSQRSAAIEYGIYMHRE